MHPAATAVLQNVAQHAHLFLPCVFLAASVSTAVNTPERHSLLITSISWALVWIFSIIRAGVLAGLDNVKRRKSCWAAGALLALAQICDRAARDREGMWWAQAFLPAVVYFLLETDLWTNTGIVPAFIPLTDHAIDGHSSADKSTRTGSSRLIFVITVTAAIVLRTPYNTAPTSALGLSTVIFTAAGLVFFENAITSTKDAEKASSRGFVSANGSFSRRESMSGARQSHYLTSLRDVAIVMAVTTGIATFCMEDFRTEVLIWSPEIWDMEGGREDWRGVQGPGRMIRQCLVMSIVNALKSFLLFVTLHYQGALPTALIAVGSYLIARLQMGASFSGVWFLIIFGAASILFLFNPSSSSNASTDRRMTTRARRLLFLLVSVSFLVMLTKNFYGNVAFRSGDAMDPPSAFFDLPPESALGPIPLDTKLGHPIDQLIKSAEQDFRDLQDRQSKSLAAAVTEYRRRYGIPPPPNFDRWYEFAQRSGVELIDEFDTIQETLLPFWALKPSTIRARVREALGMEENALIGVLIRDGVTVKVEGGPEWQQKATVGMMSQFMEFLPDMDLAFNVHDEPRVVVPHDQLSQMVQAAKDQRMPAAFGNRTPRNKFSTRPKDMNDGKRIEDFKTTRFNRFAHQQTWTHSRMSCSPESPSRSYEDHTADNLTSYSATSLGFVYNASAFGNICNSPSLSHTYGFFERPNAYNIVHDLIPIFSQSKVSSYQDILYPSPWYWDTRVGYDETRDTTWDNKTDSLYWRGSTTGGFSRNGGWRRQHRQHIVQRLNAPDTAKIIVKHGQATPPDWQIEEVPRDDFKNVIDVKFSHLGQCDEGDCDAQKEFFEVVDRVDGQDAWKWRHLLDMDGNAFSGRFYAFLKSKSLVYKMAIFQEWHKEWLKPWVHYVPLSLRGDEHLEAVRYMSGEEDGRKQAEKMAMAGRVWANKVLRNSDFEAWFFRLLLEYGRLIDDDRELIGYAGP
ncbi:hypothetical protein BU16DRAFT_521883 [Lophium mytilinum]|uniref:Glycosyl transferase CAP10 domain-containing protein n=1 Tax=Lophium mytilinum TaxID=390894 RepID=A0A6A6REQ0_9PEZI|nr:hypothetical protein BU16DRAFT_521883 [Lophium mytilinum]